MIDIFCQNFLIIVPISRTVTVSRKLANLGMKAAKSEMKMLKLGKNTVQRTYLHDKAQKESEQ